MRRAGAVALALLVALAGAVAVVLFFQSRDESTFDGSEAAEQVPGEPYQGEPTLSPALEDAVNLGNVVVLHKTARPPKGVDVLTEGAEPELKAGGPGSAHRDRADPEEAGGGGVTAAHPVRGRARASCGRSWTTGSAAGSGPARTRAHVPHATWTFVLDLRLDRAAPGTHQMMHPIVFMCEECLFVELAHGPVPPLQALRGPLRGPVGAARERRSPP